MPFTLEEAKTLDTFARLGSIGKTAEALRKANSAVVYTLSSIESKCGTKLFDRTGYRTKLLPSGERLLEICRKMLLASDELSILCQELSDGWDSDLKIIVEGIVPLEPVIQSLKQVSLLKTPTRFHIYAEFLSRVEETFLQSDAHLMISVLPPQRTTLESIPLQEVPAVLVAHKNHPLVQDHKKNTLEALKAHPLLTVRGSDPRLNMSTASIENLSTIQLNDFHSKKMALLNGLGYGWLPTYMIEDELKQERLKIIRWSKTSHHQFKPHLYYRGDRFLGKTGKLLIEKIRKHHT